MDSLFIEQPKFEKVARRILDNDATKWTKQILDEFFTEFPFFMSQSIDLQYKKKDERKGYAVGTIEAGNLSIPVIVRDFALSPFDVVYYRGVTLPLTDETLGALTNSKSAFKQVVKPDVGDNQVDLLFERSLVDLQPTPRMGKYGSVIDRISDTITKQHKEELLRKLSSDKSLQAAFETNNTVEVLYKIAKVKPKGPTYFKDSLSKVLPRDIHYLEKLGRFQYKLTLGNSDIYDPITVEMTDSQVSDLEPIKAVGKDIEKKATFKSTHGAAFDVNGNHEKLVIMNVDGMRKHAYMDVNTSSEENCNRIFGGEMPELKDYGVWTDGNKSTIPFEIVGMIKSAQHYEINGFDGTTARTYIPLRSVDKITSHESFENTYYIPTRYRFVKIGELTDIERDKTKGEFVAANYYKKDDVGLYMLQGPVFTKYAVAGGKIDNLNVHEASYAALQCGASGRSVKKLASAPVNIRIPFETVLKAPQSLEKAAALLEQEYEEYSSKIKTVAKDLVKEAAVLSDAQSVDAILALNLVTKENVLEFVQQLPLYEQVLSDLAKLLLTVRLGLSAIPEMALVRAMKGLSQVVEILRGMNNLNRIKN